VIESVIPNAQGSSDGRGYLGIELVKAPINPGSYWIKVESKTTTYRIREQSQVSTDDTPDGIYSGGWWLCTVAGGEILDENFQRVGSFTVNQPTRAYVRCIDPGESEDSTAVDVTTYDEAGAPFDQAQGVGVTRVGLSDVFLSEPFELLPVWESSGAQGVRALSTSDPKKVRVKKGAPRRPIKATKSSALVAQAQGQSGVNYLFPIGRTLPVKLCRFQLASNLYYFVCSPEASDCNDDVVVGDITWSWSPGGYDTDGDNQVVRMEKEPGPSDQRPNDPEAGWYVRGIRMNAKPDGTPRVSGCTLTLRGEAAGGLDGGESVQIEITRPFHLGTARTDGYPVTYNGADVSLENLVIDMADKYGIPPQFLMSQVTKEAFLTGDTPPRYNTYSFRYEPYGFDFKFITGDREECCDADGHKLLQDVSPSQQTHPFFRQAFLGASGKAEMLNSEGVPGDAKPGEVAVQLQPLGTGDTSQWQIPNLNGSPIEWRLRDRQTSRRCARVKRR
jgi:hypothetical protein